ncbi:MAG: radical SAM protein [Verrucomicrobiales bacterium]|nr:radical SAM protein [Verrucomicrobiales bacterium]
MGNRYVYVVLSQRARGLSIGVNLTPNKQCNFHCAYCEVDREAAAASGPIDLGVLEDELEGMLQQVRGRRLRELKRFWRAPADLLDLKEIALSGDGEPTLCPQFGAVVDTVLRCRAKQARSFKVVLITNTSGLDLTPVRRAVRRLGSDDEIWVKLDAGTEGYMRKVNAPDVTLAKVLRNILNIARQRPVVIQSLFPRLGREGPTPEEVEAYAQRLWQLKQDGAQIKLVQVYSAHRPPHLPHCSHLPLKQLSRIARRVREVAGLRAEVF